MTGVYELVCGNCDERLLLEQELKVGDVTKCSECGSYAEILGLRLLPDRKIRVMARRLTLVEARKMGYP